MKLTRKQIEVIKANTPTELKGTQKQLEDVLGMYTKDNANWSYKAGYVKYNNINILVVTVFGEVQ